VGVVAGYVARRMPGVLLVAAAAFAIAYVAHGSGFLAVFVAGLIAGRPFEAEHLPKLAEIVVFVALGLTVGIPSIAAGRSVQGLVLAAFLALVARPLVVGTLLAPVHLRRWERTFVIWGGLKGAVPILLGTFALVHHVPDAERIYETIFVVVLASVV